MKRPFLITITGIVFVILPAIMCKAESKIGLVSAYDFDKEKRVIKSYQQIVWENILSKNRFQSIGYKFEVIDEKQLVSREELAKYKLIIIPASRTTLPVGTPKSLADYVKDGGWLIRDNAGPFCLDIDGDGILGATDLTTESKKAVSSFWEEIAGTKVIAKPTYNFIKKIRVTNFFPSFSKNLPTEFVELDFSFKMPHYSYFTTYYQLIGNTKPLIEASIINTPSKNLTDEGKEIEGVFPVVAVNQYGNGICISIGINVRAMLTPPAEIYYNLFFNIFQAVVEGNKN